MLILPHPKLKSRMLREALERHVTPEFAAGFDRDHYAVFPVDAVPEALSSLFLRDIKHCFEKVAKIPNEVEFLLGSGPVKLTKPNIYECDMHHDGHRGQLPMFTQLLESELGPLVELFRDSCETLSDLCTISGTEDAKRNTTVKLQMNEGGSFPWHFDNPAKPNKRRLTMAVYLTEAWTEEMGGSLLLQPFLKPMVRVPPMKCTVALFRSDSMLHAVEPVRTAAHRTRYCFTVWFDGTDTNSDADLNLRAKHLSIDSLPLLQSTPLQRVLSRCVYDEEYRERLTVCFGENTREAKISIAMHEAHIKPLLQNPAIAAFVAELRAIKP